MPGWEFNLHAPELLRRLGELLSKAECGQVGVATHIWDVYTASRQTLLSRAVAGTIGRTVIFALPGSTAAVDLGVRRLIVPELAHIAGLLSS